MYSVRDALGKDPAGTVRAVAAMGYEGLEFYAPYFAWSEAQAKDMRKLLDELKIRCFSTHNDDGYFSGDKLRHAQELNLILGSKYMVMASSHAKPGLDGWREVADTLNQAAEKLEPHGLKAGYHNHQPEFTLTDGARPMEILAKTTKPSVMLQLDVGTCIEAGADPVAYFMKNLGRFPMVHVKDMIKKPTPTATPEQVMVDVGKGSIDWKGIFAHSGHAGIQHYFVEFDQPPQPLADIKTSFDYLNGLEF